MKCHELAKIRRFDYGYLYHQPGSCPSCNGGELGGITSQQYHGISRDGFPCNEDFMWPSTIHTLARCKIHCSSSWLSFGLVNGVPPKLRQFPYQYPTIGRLSLNRSGTTYGQNHFGGHCSDCDRWNCHSRLELRTTPLGCLGTLLWGGFLVRMVSHDGQTQAAKPPGLLSAGFIAQ